MESFSTLFREYCFRARLFTVTDFLNVVALRGFFFDESLIYKWRSGVRVPASRGLVIVLISLFRQRDVYFTQYDANKLLEKLEYRDLSLAEINELFGSQVIGEEKKYTLIGDALYSNLSELRIDPGSDINVIELDSLQNVLEREEWYRRLGQYFAEYYSFLSCGHKTVEEVYDMQFCNNFEFPREGHTLVAYYAHPGSGLKYLVGTLRILPAYSTDRVLDLLHYFDVKNEDNFLSISSCEVDRVFIPDWAWKWRIDITQRLFQFVRQRYQLRWDDMYAILSHQLGEVLHSSGLVVDKLPDTYHLANNYDAQSNFATAYQDWYFFKDYWKLYSSVYRIF